MIRILAALLFIIVPAAAQSVLVLPFVNVKQNPNLNWIGESVADSIQEALAGEGQLVLIVQGAAGSGKTTIALHRLSYLIYHNQSSFASDRLLIIAPNRIFMDYISDVLPELGVDSVPQDTFEGLAARLLGVHYRTAFVLSRPDPVEPKKPRFVLVTAEHVLRQMTGDEATVLYRRREADGGYTKSPAKLKVRDGGKAVWTRHPTADVAVMDVSPPPEASFPEVPAALLSSDADLSRYEVHPGDLIRCVGFPHPNQFQANESGFGVARLGCIASYPLLPTNKTIAAGHVHGARSEGMICLDGELGLIARGSGLQVFRDETVIGKALPDVMAISESLLVVSVSPSSAATSRAMPIIDRQRAMFGSTSISRTTSPIKSASGMPTGASSSRRMMPSCSSLMPSS